MSKRKTITDATKHKVFAKGDYTCKVCGFFNPQGNGLHVDHIISIFEGGGNNLDNYQCLCSVCNLIKGALLASITNEPPQVTDMLYADAMTLIENRRANWRKKVGRKANAWERRKNKTEELLEKEVLHWRQRKNLAKAIQDTFGLRKELLDLEQYLPEYKKRLKASTPAACKCVFAY